jgi:hypothetical protein
LIALALLAISPTPSGKKALSTTGPELGASPTLVALMRYWGSGLAPGTRFEGSGVIVKSQAGPLSAFAAAARVSEARTPTKSALLILFISVPPLGGGSPLALVLGVLLVLFGVLLCFLVRWLGVFGADEALARRFALALGSLRGAVAGIDAFAGDRWHLVLGGKASPDPGVIDVLQFVAILADEVIAGEEEDVVAAG